jgi:serine/threonine protein kinase
MSIASAPADRWSIVRGLFEAVSALGSTQRSGFLDFACPDVAIRTEVESLLKGHEASSDWDMPCDRRVEDATEQLPEISGFSIERLLGTGGAGSVYSAQSAASGRRVAIKVLRTAAANSQAVQRFRQECRALARLSHPGIVQLIETGVARGGVTYLVMEFVEGQSIDAWLQANEPSAERCIDVIRDVLAALAHAHDAGVIHRDIKPHNVMVTPEGRVKLVDFGVARLSSDEGRRTGFRTETGHLVGTFAYMSPEQADGRSERIGVASDVYQAALLLFEMLAGRLPYEADGRSAAGLLRAVLMDERMRLDAIRPEMDAGLSDLLDRALSIDPARRPQSVRQFDAELSAFCAVAR